MNVVTPNKNTTFFTAKKLIPFSQYKGPILKLTKAEKAQIAHLESEIAALECDLYRISNYQKLKLSESQLFSSQSTEMHLDGMISSLRKMIKEIKANRLRKQQEKLNKSKLNINA